MVLLPGLLDGLARSVSLKKGKKNRHGNVGREAAEAIAKEAKKKALMLSSSGTVHSNKSHNFASACSKRGTKGINQDSLVVWEEFGCQEDMIFCGIFDGHGSWGHLVSKKIRVSVPSSLLCNWQEAIAEASLLGDETDHVNNLHDQRFNIWKQSYLKTYAAIDEELKQHPRIDSFRSGSTALTIVRQSEHLIIANVGDSRAVLATTCDDDDDDGKLVAVQLTVDLRPNVPEEAERIRKSKGRVFCLEDEPGVYRVWMPDAETPGLAVSRAFGDYCVKDFGLISVPQVTHRLLATDDRFVIVATDGVWDVISNEEAVGIVGSTQEREKSATRLVESAARAWKRKRRGIAVDDISAICLFFHHQPHNSNFASTVAHFSLKK